MVKKKHTRPVAKTESETAPTNPPTLRRIRIIPAEPADAFWNFSKLLSDLLCWATHPGGKTLNLDWRESYKNRIRGVADATIRSVEHLGDDSLVKKVKAAQRLGFELATLLCDRPALSTVAVESWTVPRYRQLFDDLSALEREFKLRGDGELPTPPTAAKPLPSYATTANEWTEWRAPKTAIKWFPTIKKPRSWSAFASKLRKEKLLKDHPISGFNLCSIHQSVFTRRSLNLPADVPLIALR